MSISGTVDSRNCGPTQMMTELSGFVDAAARDGISMREFERGLLDRLLQVGFQLTEEFLQRQGNGDCGETCESSGKTLYRSENPQRRALRTIFGEHAYECFVYRVRRHPNSAIAARPVDDRLGLAPDRYSPLLQEFSMMFCTELAFRPGAEAFDTIFGQQLSVDTLEHLSRTRGAEAGEFMETLPAPAADEEGEFLVMSADGKGIPMVRADAVRLRACDPRPDRPGNRRMASVAAVYSVDPFVRTSDQILAALFRSESTEQPDAPPRPQPQHKRYTARFGQVLPDLETPATGTQLAMVWVGNEVERRLQPGQKLIQIMDGQHSLWDEADAGLSVPEANTVEILDLLHVCSYVWTAAKALHAAREDQEAFVKDKLVALLEGRVVSMIRSLRHLATRHGLRGSKRDDIDRVCGYFESHRNRMQYDEYLATGYPIATGVIEGACRHLVKDRMERSGMKWTEPGAQGLLHLRCLRASGLWEQFHQQRSARTPECQLSS
jgi:hypothetical protein